MLTLEKFEEASDSRKKSDESYKAWCTVSI